jgi:beta-lactamase regulating signal transducer with metallopeptidase domain
MTLEQFLIHWIVRSALLILAGDILLRVFRVRNASVRSAAWRAVLCASAAMPILSGLLPSFPLSISHAEPVFLREASTVPRTTTASLKPESPRAAEYDESTDEATAAMPITAGAGPQIWRVDWGHAALIVYAVVCAILLLRIDVGLTMGAQLRRKSLSTERKGVRESSALNSPVTIGIVTPTIILPVEWREWDDTRLDAVLAHERSHIEHRDPAVQLFSAIHRALLWANPLSWYLHAKLVQAAEEVSDDAAVAVCDRVKYAEILLQFMRMPGAIRPGLSMARHGNPEKRLLRILDEPLFSIGLTKWAATSVLAVSLPVSCLIAAARAEFAQPSHEVLQLPALKMPEFSVPLSPASVDRIPAVASRTPMPGPVLAQVAAPTSAPVTRARLTPEVRLTFSVTDAAGRYVTGLRRQDFGITEGQTPLEITNLDDTAAEHSVVLVNTIPGSDDAVNALRKTLDPSDQLAVVTGPEASDAALFWDAVAGAVNQAKQMTNLYRSVIVMMRGGSDFPMGREADLARILRLALHSPRVTVSFANVEDITRPLDRGSQQDDLRIIATVTGGQVVPAASGSELATSVTRIGVGLIHQYVLGFIPNSVPAGVLARPPKVEIVTGGLPALRTIGPSGYYVEP